MMLMAMMASTSGFQVMIPTDLVADTAPLLCGAGIVFESDGDVLASRTSSGNENIGSWISPKDLAPGAFTIRADLVSGVLAGSSSATGTDLAMTSNRRWDVLDETGLGAEAVVTIAIKLGGTTLVSKNVTLTALATLGE